MNALQSQKFTDSTTNVIRCLNFQTRSTHINSLFLYVGKRRYNTKLFKSFTDLFNRLPVAAVIDDKIFCCHGGLSPDLNHVDQIRHIRRPTDVPNQGLQFKISLSLNTA